MNIKVSNSSISKVSGGQPNRSFFKRTFHCDLGSTVPLGTAPSSLVASNPRLALHGAAEARPANHEPLRSEELPAGERGGLGQ